MKRFGGEYCNSRSRYVPMLEWITRLETMIRVQAGTLVALAMTAEREIQ